MVKKLKIGSTKRSGGKTMILKSYVGAGGKRKKGRRVKKRKTSKRGKGKVRRKTSKKGRKGRKRKSPKIGDTRRNDAGRLVVYKSYVGKNGIRKKGWRIKNKKKKYASFSGKGKRRVAKGVTRTFKRGQLSSIRSRPGSSSYGQYKNIPAHLFCGSAGGAARYSYPVNSRKRAIAALSYAHRAPRPQGIRDCVHKIAASKGWLGPRGHIKRR